MPRVFDLVISGAVIVDGTGASPSLGSVALQGDRIAWIGRGDDPLPPATDVVDASGALLAPGFIDVHNHSDLSPLLFPQMTSLVRQGVTSVVVGNCGSSPWPLAAWDEAVSLAYGSPGELESPSWAGFGEYLDALDAARPAVNVAALVGHGSVRHEVMGSDRRSPSGEELDRMRRLIADAMEGGAVGLSTGLIYVPGIYSATDEIVALAAETARYGGLYAGHIRGEGEHLFRAVAEALEIGERAGLPVHISHLKCESSLVWGQAGRLLETLHAGRDATGDQYPYTAWNSSLASLLPPWAPVEEVERFARDSGERERLRFAVEEGETEFQSSVKGVGWDRIVIEATAEDRWQGMNVQAIADEMGFDPFVAFLRLLAEEPETSCIGHAMDEDDVLQILADPDVFVASDSSATAPDGPGGSLPVHPREYGTFPRALALARDHDLMPTETVIRKMTSLPAERFGLTGRGRIEEGAFADLVLFDPAEIRDTATYEWPHAFPEGLRSVIVNGSVAWESGTGSITRSGRTIRR
jgi:N-acyl-D-amino-acid deacylase